MAEAAGSADQHQATASSCSHVSTFSARHPMIPSLYVMPWRRDMKNQRLLVKNAALAQIPVVPLEESCCLCGRERLSSHRSSSSSSSSSSAPLSQSGLTAHNSSHFSRYNSSAVTSRRLYRT